MKPTTLAATLAATAGNLIITATILTATVVLLPSPFDEEAPAAQRSETLTEEEFIAEIHSLMPGLSADREGDIISLGTATCEALETGVDRQFLIDGMNAEADTPGYVAEAVVDAAVRTYCPELNQLEWR